MRNSFLAAILMCGGLGNATYGLHFFELGNKPQSPENYKTWPNLVDVVNDQSRIHLSWTNGNELLSYSGDTDDLNRVLKEFAETRKSERLEVVIRPGSLQRTFEVNGRKQVVDWQLQIHGGLVRDMVIENQLQRVMPLDPRLTIWVTDRIDLDALEIPDNLTVLQLFDLQLNLQFELLLQAGKDREIVQYTTIAIEEINQDAKRTGTEADAYQACLRAIRESMDRRHQRKK